MIRTAREYQGDVVKAGLAAVAVQVLEAVIIVIRSHVVTGDIHPVGLEVILVVVLTLAGPGQGVEIALEIDTDVVAVILGVLPDRGTSRVVKARNQNINVEDEVLALDQNVAIGIQSLAQSEAVKTETTAVEAQRKIEKGKT